MEHIKKVPALRFSEFSGEWVEKELKDIALINPKNYSLPDEFIYIDLESVEKGILLKETTILKNEAPSRAQRLLKKEDVLFQMVRPYQRNNLFFNNNGDYVASTGYAQIRAYENARFLYQFFHLDDFIAEVINRCTGTSYPAINSSDLATISIKIPSIKEQQKIADFLSQIDNRIEKITKKKQLLEDYKKGVMQKIFSQALRFKDENGLEFPRWEEKSLVEVLTPQFREVEKPKWSYLAIGIRSHCKGTFQKPEANPEKNAMDNLFQVKENDLIVNITFAWEGAIAIVKKEDNNGFVSHRFPTYVFKEKVTNSKFFQYVFIRPRFREQLDSISPGGAGRNRVMSKKDFLKIKCELPTVPEQQKIADFLTEIDNKISQVSKQLEGTKKYKKSLLQQMFV